MTDQLIGGDIDHPGGVHGHGKRFGISRANSGLVIKGRRNFDDGGNQPCPRILSLEHLNGATPGSGEPDTGRVIAPAIGSSSREVTGGKVHQVGIAQVADCLAGWLVDLSGRVDGNREGGGASGGTPCRRWCNLEQDGLRGIGGAADGLQNISVSGGGAHGHPGREGGYIPGKGGSGN